MSEKRKPPAHRLQFPLFGKELAIWLFFSLAAMILALPVSLWLNRGSEEDFLRLIRYLAASRTEFFEEDSLQSLAALPPLPMELPLRFAPASAEQAQNLAVLSPSVTLLGQLAESASPPPLFDKSLVKYDRLINETASQYQVSPLLVKALIQVESSFDPLAVSDRGAVGLMQVMPSTARAMGIKNPMIPEKNIVAGVRYLKNLLVQFDDDERLAVAAYNCGPEAMKHHGNSPPYRETRNFVKKVMSYYNYYLI